MKSYTLSICITLISLHVFSQNTDSVKLIMSADKKDFIKINKTKISFSNLKYSSIAYNFSLQIPSSLKLIPCESGDGCIFDIYHDASIQFWLSNYSNLYVSKNSAISLMKSLDSFKSLLRLNLIPGGEIISDSIKTIFFGDIPGYQYSCTFNYTNGTSTMKGKMIVSQVFYKNFNYRILGTFDREDKNSIKLIESYNALIKNFKILKTSE